MRPPRKLKISYNKELATKVASHLVEVIISMIEAQRKSQGDAFARGLTFMFIDRFLGTLVYQALNQEPPKGLNKEDQYNFVAKNFADIKYDIQEYVALGFSTGASAFSGKILDYYCKLSVVPDPINTDPC